MFFNVYLDLSSQISIRNEGLVREVQLSSVASHLENLCSFQLRKLFQGILQFPIFVLFLDVIGEISLGVPLLFPILFMALHHLRDSEV